MLWILRVAWDKINLVHTWRELKALGKKYGRRFFIAAVLWDMLEALATIALLCVACLIESALTVIAVRINVKVVDREYKIPWLKGGAWRR